MNPRLWLGLSLLGNIVLLAACGWLLLRSSPEHDSAMSPRNEAFAVEALSAAPARPAPPAVRFGGPLESPIEWHDAMAELRRVGVPSPIIAKVVSERIARKWTDLEARFERQYLNDEIDAKRLAELHDERAREEERELRAALGEGYRDWHKEHVVQNMYLGGLRPSEEQKEPLYTLQIEWLRESHGLELAKRDGQLSQADFENAYTAAEANYKQKLAAIIGAERVFGEPADAGYAAQVRRDFARLQLTADQVEALTGVQKKWSEVRMAMAQSLAQTQEMDPAYSADLQAIDRGRDEEYRRILGDEAFTLWQRAGDDRHRVLRNHAAAWGFDAQQVGRTYEQIRSYELAVAAFEHQALARENAGQSVDWAAIDETIASYTKETVATLRATLGDGRLDTLQREGIFSPRMPNPARHDPNVRAATH